MKKILVLVFAVAILAAPRAQAQDSMVFNHMALGVTAGFDGVGLDIAMPLGNAVQFRVGYGTDIYGSLIPVNLNVNLGTFTSGDKTVNLNNIPLSVNVWKSGNGHFFADFYPTKGNFHISAGVFVNNGKLVSAQADLSKALDKQNWGVGIGPQGGFTVSTDQNGQLMMDVKTWAVNPYVGVGFGRAVNREKTFNFVFDLGIMVWGTPSVHGYNYAEHIFDESRPVKDVLIDAESVKPLSSQAADILDMLSSVPVCPYMRFGFYFKLF